MLARPRRRRALLVRKLFPPSFPPSLPPSLPPFPLGGSNTSTAKETTGIFSKKEGGKGGTEGEREGGNAVSGFNISTARKTTGNSGRRRVGGREGGGEDVCGVLIFLTSSSLPPSCRPFLARLSYFPCCQRNKAGCISSSHPSLPPSLPPFRPLLACLSYF